MNTIAVFSFGRFNPPTTGHELMVTRSHEYAITHSADYFLFPSPSIDKHPKRGPLPPEKCKNPIPHSTKTAILRRLFPTINIIEEPSVYSPQQVIEYLGSRGYQELVFAVGSDRVDTFKVRWLPYALDELKSASVVSFGDRDPDADDDSGRSATKARAAAIDGNFQGFQSATGWPDPEITQELYYQLRLGMGLENLEWQTESINTR